MKKINLYKQEITDGLRELVVGKTSSSVLCAIKPCLPFPAKFSLATAQNLGQEDLYYLNTILVSSGWNLNDEVFLPEEIWSARATPEDKPLNYEHVADDIIGHITETIVINDNQEKLSEDTAVEDLPDKIHILSSAVLYRFIASGEPEKRMQKIISEINENKWFVSMECLFTDFDYALKNEASGENKVIARNEKTAFLTKHLRAYGGKGIYEGYKVGRVLKDFIFSGKGLVANPANPESIILSSHSKKFNAVYCHFNEKTFGENKKMEELNKQVVELEGKLKAKAEEVASLQTKVADLEKEKKELADEKAKLATEVETNTAKLKELTENLSKVEAEKTKAERINIVVDKLGYNKEEASAWVEDLKALSNEGFNSTVDKLKAKLESIPKAMPASQPPGEMGKPIKTLNLASTAEKLESAVVTEPNLSVNTEVQNDVLKDLANYFGDK